MNLADIIKQSKHKAITAKIRAHLEAMHGRVDQAELSARKSYQSKEIKSRGEWR